MKKHVKEKRLAIKLFICLVYLVIITILLACSYKLYEQKNVIVSWSEVENVDNYTYINIYKMSEKFAFYEEKNIGIHFVIEKEDSGLWHTYLIAIDEKNYDKYKKIIDYTYERTKEEPKPIKVYGYPVIINQDLKELAIKNIPNFVPAENEVEITNDNFEKYLTNSYLDTTRKQKDEFSVVLCVSLILLFIVMALLVLTILDKDRIVDNLDEKIEEEFEKTKKRKNKRRII